VLPNEKVRIQSVRMDMVTSDIKQEERHYRFLSPWLALNQENYSKYKRLQWNNRKSLLESIFIGNILSALKGMKVFINFRLSAEIQNLRQITTVAHDNQFVGFHAIVRTNIKLPQYIGIGKSASKGFGTITESK
jgi:tRNA U38,U39,U40 pseudouridine synthase TruA